MTKKHFTALASAIAAAWHHTTSVEDEEMILILTDRIADACAADNPRFDRARFLEACRQEA